MELYELKAQDYQTNVQKEEINVQQRKKPGATPLKKTFATRNQTKTTLPTPFSMT